MSMIKEIKVPDIGDFSDVEVIEILVKPGDSLKAEDPVMTLESDMATMDVPCAEDGIRDSVASRGLGDVYKRQVQSQNQATLMKLPFAKHMRVHRFVSLRENWEWISPS